MIKVKVQSSAPINTKVTSIKSVTGTQTSISPSVNIKVNNSNSTIPLSATQAQIQYGHSAYDLAVLNGYTGTLQQWLDSLIGRSPYVNDQTNTWWAYNSEQGWYDTTVTADKTKPLLSDIVIKDDDCLIIDCGTSTEVITSIGDDQYE